MTKENSQTEVETTNTEDQVTQLNEEILHLRELKEDATERVRELEAQVDSLLSQITDQNSDDYVALQWLETNCENYEIHRNQQTGKIRVSGTVSRRSKQGGYIERYTPKVFRKNGKAPYLIHEGSTFKVYREVKFDYISKDESLAEVVAMIATTYCPGDQKIHQQEFKEDQQADYGNRILWVLPADRYKVTLDEFSELPVVGPDHINRTVEGL